MPTVKLSEGATVIGRLDGETVSMTKLVYSKIGQLRLEDIRSP